MHSCLPSCHCRSEESRKIGSIDLSSLEVAEISGFSGSHEQMEFVEFLSSNAGVLKRLLINDEFCSMPKEVREKVRSMCHPNVEVDFFVFRKGKLVLVDKFRRVVNVILYGLYYFLHNNFRLYVSGAFRIHL